jgi:hypothetical protein
LQIGADGRQKPRSQDFLCAGQTSKEIVIKMVLEEGFDLFAVLIQLLIQQAVLCKN